MTRGKPGRSCTVCAHAARGAIGGKLLAGVPQHAIAREHRLSADAISRHFLRHLSAAAAAAGPVASPAADAGTVDLLGTIGTLQNRLMALLHQAERSRDIRATVLSIREARQLLEMHGKLAGMIGPDGTATHPGRPGGEGGADSLRARVLAKLNALAPPAIDAAEPT